MHATAAIHTKLTVEPRGRVLALPLKPPPPRRRQEVRRREKGPAPLLEQPPCALKNLKHGVKVHVHEHVERIHNVQRPRQPRRVRRGGSRVQQHELQRRRGRPRTRLRLCAPVEERRLGALEHLAGQIHARQPGAAHADVPGAAPAADANLGHVRVGAEAGEEVPC